MILAVTVVTLLVAPGVRATPSVLIVPLELEFGWSRSTVSAVSSSPLPPAGTDWSDTTPAE